LTAFACSRVHFVVDSTANPKLIMLIGVFLWPK
jgi:hypothetical protein